MSQFKTKTLVVLGLCGTLGATVPLTSSAQTTDSAQWNQGQAELQKQLTPGMASDSYRGKLKKLGYKITSTNYNNADYLEYEIVKDDQQNRSLNSQPPASGFPATEGRGVTTPDKQALPGSGKMAEEDRTGSTGPSGTRTTSMPNTGAVDAVGRVTKPLGDEAVTEVDRGLAAGIRSSLLGHPDFSGSEENVHLIVDNGFVTIQGWVPSEQDRRAIADRIQEQAGVQGINNQLLVRSQTSRENRR